MSEKKSLGGVAFDAYNEGTQENGEPFWSYLPHINYAPQPAKVGLPSVVEVMDVLDKHKYSIKSGWEIERAEDVIELFKGKTMSAVKKTEFINPHERISRLEEALEKAEKALLTCETVIGGSVADPPIQSFNEIAVTEALSAIKNII